MAPSPDARCTRTYLFILLLYVLKINQDVPPTVVQCQKVPFALEASFKKELQRMVELGVIELVLEPTILVNPVRVVRKPSGQLRICLDLQQLHKTVKREYCQLPTFEELTVNMKGATINKGFWQIKLNEETSKLTIFSEWFSGLEGVAVCVDDVVVWGKDRQEHDACLEKVLERASDNNDGSDSPFMRKHFKIKKKKILVSTPVLQYFNSQESLTLSVDASSEGLGAVIMQNSGPIAYASKHLSDCQKNYAST
ncbi:hypothetical protein PR048_005535 [Dryococelus australis]|uniref:Reverse transcriptase/retrotransposon-derived protein RNase H-like domain-containing protein n=1 Tax=Dryococelus australis TaxID=614101 RepID=A0ABQ9I8G9_9NEOP|nr:hypothetical protein PR048_005535 [Dryococelus australis]